MENNEDEGAIVELANVALREEMLRFNVLNDTNDRYPVLRLLTDPDRKLVVPVHLDPNDPGAMPRFASMFKHDKGVELHVYTSVMFIPEACPADTVMFYPFNSLVMDVWQDGEVKIFLIDPGTEHGVGFLIDEEGPNMFRLKRAEDAFGSRDFFTARDGR